MSDSPFEPWANPGHLWFPDIAGSGSMSAMPKYQVIVRGKDNELQTYDIKADAVRTDENAAYLFHMLGDNAKPVAFFQISQVVGVLVKDSQE